MTKAVKKGLFSFGWKVCVEEGVCVCGSICFDNNANVECGGGN